MKANRRTRWVLAAALFSLVLTLVTLVAPPSALPLAGSSGPVHLGSSDAGREVELRADQFLEIQLEANPAAGYGWYVQDVDATVLRQVGEPSMEATSPLLGAPSIITLRFSPQAAGQSPLVLAYRRPWEDVAPLKTFTVQVTADGAYVGAETFDTPLSAPASNPLAAAGSASVASLPSALNWCTLAGCTPVRDQRTCGSCWAFATTGVLEQNIRIVEGINRDLSEQYLLSCNSEGWSCNGGWWAHDYHWWKRPAGEPAAGAVRETAFAYTASKVACNPPHTHYETIADWRYVGSAGSVPSVAALKQAIYDHGPVAVAVCTGSYFHSYRGGVLTSSDTCSGPVNHGVVLVGWDDSLGPGGAWILRNSWGSGWGEGGYMKIAYGVSNVGYGASYIVRGTMPHSPLAPSNLVAVGGSTSRIDLSWRDNSDNESGFRIERSPDGSGSWLLVGTVGANVQTWSNSGLPLSTTYHYRVQATNSWGNSPFSNAALARTWPDPSQVDEVVYVPLVGRDFRP
jgi:inhibitor of cysteine peptidase